MTALSGTIALRKAVRLPAPAVLTIGVCLFLISVGAIFLARLVWELGGQLVSIQIPHGHYDFLAFYAAAHFVLQGQAGQLYDPPAVASFQHTLVSHNVGAKGYMPFLNPPFAAVLQAPLALLPEPVARTVWFVFNAVLAVSVVRWLTDSIPGKQRLAAAALLLGTFPVYQALVEGQWSIVLLLASLAAVQFARRGAYGKAGLCLSALWLKPQLALIVLAGLLLFRCWRVVFGMTAMGVLMVVLTLPFTGLQPYLSYVVLVFRVFGDHFNGAGALYPTTWQGSLSLTEGINGLFVGWFDQSSVVLVDLLAISCIGATALLYQRAVLSVRPGFGYINREMMLLASLALGLLVDPHLYPQDITLLLVAIPILLPRLKSPLPMLACFCLLLDAPFLDQVVPLHIFTVLLWAAAILICVAMIRRPPQRPDGERRGPRREGIVSDAYRRSMSWMASP